MELGICRRNDFEHDFERLYENFRSRAISQKGRTDVEMNRSDCESESGRIVGIAQKFAEPEAGLLDSATRAFR